MGIVDIKVCCAALMVFLCIGGPTSSGVPVIRKRNTMRQFMFDHALYVDTAPAVSQMSQSRTFDNRKEGGESEGNIYTTGITHLNLKQGNSQPHILIDTDNSASSDIWNWIVHTIKEAVKGIDFGCDFCKAMTFLIQQLLVLKESQDEIAKAVTALCKVMNVEDDRVCDSIIQVFKGEVLTVLDHLALSPEQVCGVIVGDSCASPYNPFSMWNITLPHIPKPPVVPPIPPQAGSPTIRVLHLTDVHIDLKYKEGSNVNCDEPLCCRADDGPVKGEPAGKWGAYGNCDVPSVTFDNLLKHLSTKEKIDYIIWTGDIPAHEVWNETKETQLNFVDYFTTTMLKYFPQTPVFCTVGNHESVPVNSFPQPSVHGKEAITWLYNGLANSWQHWLPNTTLPDIRLGAYYTVLLKTGFRLVSLNMNYCNNENWWLLLDMTDPAHELNWLINVLQRAENTSEKVHIIGHIPPGDNACLKAWSWNYYKIVNRYENTITAQFYGHTHTDSLEIFYDDVAFKRPVNVAYVTPSITTYGGLNPGYRIFEIDGFYSNSTFAVLDHETYIMNLTDANLHNKPQWFKEYSAKDAYNLANLFPQDWHDWSHMLETDNAMFEKYYNYFYKMHTPGDCDDSCRKQFICVIWSARSYDGRFCKDYVDDYAKLLKWRQSMKLC